MKELKVVLPVLAFAIGFGYTVPATSNFQDPYYYPNTIKGGLQTTQKQPAQIAALGVEGKYEYYLQYLKFKTDYRKIEEHPGPENSGLNSACNTKDTLESSTTSSGEKIS